MRDRTSAAIEAIESAGPRISLAIGPRLCGRPLGLSAAAPLRQPIGEAVAIREPVGKVRDKLLPLALRSLPSHRLCGPGLVLSAVAPLRQTVREAVAIREPVGKVRHKLLPLALRSLPSGRLGALGDAKWDSEPTVDAPKTRYVSGRLPRLFVDRQALNGPLTCLLRSDQSRCDHE